MNRKNKKPSLYSLKTYENKTLLLLFFINTFIVFIAYFLFLRTHFSIDSYSHMWATSSETANVHISGGRWLNAVIMLFFDKLGIHRVWNQQVGFLLLATVLALSPTLLMFRIKDSSKQMTWKDLIMLDIIVLMSFVNAFTAEIFSFPEATILFAVGILLATLAVFFLTETWSFKRIVIACILLILCCSIYQILFEIFVIYALCILLMQNDFRFDKNALVKTLEILAIGFLSIIASLALSSFVIRFYDLVPNIRSAVFSADVIFGNVHKIAIFQKEFLYGGLRLVPHALLAVFICTVFVLLFFTISQLKDENKRSIIDFAFIVSIIVGCYIIIFAPHLVSPVFWPAPRTMTALFSWLSLISITVFALSGKAVVRNMVAILCATLMLVNIFVIQQVAADQLIVNAMDRQYAEDVFSQIKEYEQNTGNVVTGIATRNDMVSTYGYFNSTRTITLDLNVKSIISLYAFNGLMQYVSGRHFEKIDMDEEVFENNFADKNWGRFMPEEQIIFKDSIMYLMIY